MMYVLVFLQLTLVLTNGAETPLSRFSRSTITENCLFHMCNQTDYPEDYIYKIVQKDTRFSEVFGDIIEPFSPRKIGRLGVGLENICEVRQVMMFPQTARNIFNQKKTIVNVPGHHQGVMFEYCVHEGITCIQNEFLPSGFGTSCKQQYVKVRMVSVTGEGQLVQDYFAIPSGCACTRINTEHLTYFPGKPCSLLSNETLGYISFCKQKYITRRLISLSEEGQPTTDVFEVPSSCCCSYRKLPLEMLSFK